MFGVQLITRSGGCEVRNESPTQLSPAECEWPPRVPCHSPVYSVVSGINRGRIPSGVGLRGHCQVEKALRVMVDTFILSAGCDVGEA